MMEHIRSGAKIPSCPPLHHRVGNIGEVNLYRIARALDISLSELFAEVERSEEAGWGVAAGLRTQGFPCEQRGRK